jgi:hypothetical protein
MTTKKCFKCQKLKPLDEFYKHSQMADGYLNKCKLCTKKDVKRRYYDPEAIVKIVAYERERARDPARKAKALTYQKRRRARFPEKNIARGAVNNAIRKGRLQRLPCEVCGVPKSEAHHTDYLKPLDVKWLCRKHHLEAEGKKSYSSSQNI